MLSHSACYWGNYDEIRKVLTERQIVWTWVSFFTCKRKKLFTVPLRFINHFSMIEDGQQFTRMDLNHCPKSLGPHFP